MNIIALHDQDKEVSAKMFFKGEKGMATAIQLHKTGILKEHVTQVPALLLCIKGKVILATQELIGINCFTRLNNWSIYLHKCGYFCRYPLSPDL